MEGSILKKIKKGDIVGRISYGKDIFFIVDRIIKFGNNSRSSNFKRINNQNKSR